MENANEIQPINKFNIYYKGFIIDTIKAKNEEQALLFLAEQTSVRNADTFRVEIIDTETDKTIKILGEKLSLEKAEYLNAKENHRGDLYIINERTKEIFN